MQLLVDRGLGEGGLVPFLVRLQFVCLLEKFLLQFLEFAGAEWARAAAECDRVIDNARGDRELIDRAKLLKCAIPNFGRNFDDGKKKFKQKQLSTAARPLRSAYQLFKQMKLTANPYGRELEDMLAQASVVRMATAVMRRSALARSGNAPTARIRRLISP